MQTSGSRKNINLQIQSENINSNPNLDESHHFAEESSMTFL